MKNHAWARRRGEGHVEYIIITALIMVCAMVSLFSMVKNIKQIAGELKICQSEECEKQRLQDDLEKKKAEEEKKKKEEEEERKRDPEKDPEDDEKDPDKDKDKPYGPRVQPPPLPQPPLFAWFGGNPYSWPWIYNTIFG